jgi:inner membrane protein
MASIITHPVVPIAIASIFPGKGMTPAVIITGAACSIVPDFDVIGFGFGIHYGDLLGHRGITHSIFFAIILGAFLTFILSRNAGKNTLPVFLFLFLSTLTHPILDAMTNGGLGVALLAPFYNTRYFLPWRPIVVSPIGVAGFFSEWGLRVILSELLWVWIPSAIVFCIGRYYKKEVWLR